MYSILGASYVFEILKTIILLVPVFMIDLMALRKRSAKGSHYQTMDRMIFLRFAAMPQSDAHIPVCGDVSFTQRFDRRNILPSAICPRSNAPDLSAVINFVNSFVSNYRTPFHEDMMSQFGFDVKGGHK